MAGHGDGASRFQFQGRAAAAVAVSLCSRCVCVCATDPSLLKPEYDCRPNANTFVDDSWSMVASAGTTAALTPTAAAAAAAAAVPAPLSLPSSLPLLFAFLSATLGIVCAATALLSVVGALIMADHTAHTANGTRTTTEHRLTAV